MFGSSFGDLVLKRVEPPNPLFADEFNVSQQTAVLVFDELRAAVSLPFQVHRLKMPMWCVNVFLQLFSLFSKPQAGLGTGPIGIM